MTQPRLLFFATVMGVTLLFLACSDDPMGNPTVEPEASVPVDSGVDAEGPDDEDTIPCEPRAVLQTVCQQCHARPPGRGAPFPLVRRSDVLAVRSNDPRPVRERMIEQLTNGRMPLAPATIRQGEKDLLLGWLHDGAPAIEATGCATVDDAGDQ